MVGEFFISLFFSLALAYLSQYLAPRLSLCDHPDNGHKQHGRTVAIGGWTLVLATIPAFWGLPELWSLWLGGLVALGTGLLDDRFGLSPPQKLLGQLLAALIAAMLAGWQISSVNLWGVEIALGWLALPCTIFWIVGAINAFNLIDGLDGLAVGGALIICGALAWLAWQAGHQALLTLLLGLVGALGGFLIFNFWPARVFLGDSGAHFLGYWLAIFTVEATQPRFSLLLENVPILVSLLLLGLPIADTAWAILRRLRDKKPIFQADRRHLHHRLLALGLGEQATVLILYGVFALFCAAAWLISR